jgi:hypothetical protein
MASEIFDKYGNKLYSLNGVIHLQLKSGVRRTIGVIEKDTFITSRKLGVHRFQKMDGIGFNWQLMNKGKFSKVEVALSDGRTLRTTRSWILKHGSTKMFKEQGFELQMFLPLEMFKGFIEAEPPPDKENIPFEVTR